VQEGSVKKDKTRRAEQKKEGETGRLKKRAEENGEQGKGDRV